MSTNFVEAARRQIFGNDRQEKRDQKKSKLADLEIAAARNQSLGGIVAGKRLEKDAAADECENICAPLREKRGALENEMRDYLVSGKPVPSQLHRQLDELNAKISNATADLALKIADIDKEIQLVNSERKSLAPQIGQIPSVRSALSSKALADPELLDRRAINANALEWANRRRTSILRDVADLKGTLSSQQRERQEQAKTNSRGGVIEEAAVRESELRTIEELDRLQLFLADVDSEIAKLAAEKDRIRQAILDE